MNETVFEIVTGYPVYIFEKENKKLTDTDKQNIETFSLIYDELPADMDKYQKVRLITRKYWQMVSNEQKIETRCCGLA